MVTTLPDSARATRRMPAFCGAGAWWPTLMSRRPSDVLADLTRREFVTVLTAAGLLAASRGDSAGSDGARELVDAFGVTVSVPEDLTRVVAADNVTLPWVLELGGVQLAAGGFPGTYDGGRAFQPELDALGADRVQAYSRNEPNYELVAALRPDFIIGSVFATEGLDKAARYRQIAPTYIWDHQDGALSPQDQLREVARVLGPAYQRTAETIIERFEPSIVEFAGDIAIDSFSVVLPFEDQFFLYTGDEPVTALLADLLDVSVTPGAAVKTEPVSYERLDELEGEALLVLAGSAGERERRRRDRRLGLSAGQAMSDDSAVVYDLSFDTTDLTPLEAARLIRGHLRQPV